MSVRGLIALLLGSSVLGLVAGCGSTLSLPRLGRVSPTDLLAADEIVVSKVTSVRFGAKVNSKGDALRIAKVSLTDIVSLQGSLNGSAQFTVYVPGSIDNGSPDPVNPDIPVAGQWRIVFLRWEGTELRSIRDKAGYSFLTATESGSGRVLPKKPISHTIVKLLLIPSAGKIQSPYPHSIGSLVEFFSVPMIGRAMTFHLLEEALQAPEDRIHARMCESLLYMTGLPHRCLQRQKNHGGYADGGIRNAVEVQRESFRLLSFPEAARKAVISRCMGNVPANLDKKIDPREDCIQLAVAALSSSSPDWDLK